MSLPPTHPILRCYLLRLNLNFNNIQRSWTNEQEAPKSESGLHVDRTVGRSCHYQSSHWPASASSAKGARDDGEDAVLEQPQADRTGHAQLSRRQPVVSTRLLVHGLLPRRRNRH